MRISVINHVCRQMDAIGEAVSATCLALASHAGWHCRLYTFSSDFPDLDTRLISGAADILRDQFFVNSDVHIFHFGFYTPLFELLAAGQVNTKRIVRFHNVTPKKFVTPDVHPLIDRSMEQIALVDFSDEVWADSPFNRADLITAGIDPRKILVEPLFIKQTYRFDGPKPTDCINIIYVGRFVKSKGVLDLIEAAQHIFAPHDLPICVRLCGSETFSDRAYIDEVKEKIDRLGLAGKVLFIGGVSDHDLASLYRTAHLMVIPSYHEGFCVPLIEALGAGVLPIAYDAGNVPFLLEGVGEVVEVGNIDALATSINQAIDWLVRSRTDAALSLRLNGEPVSQADYKSRVARQLERYSIEAFHERVVGRVSSVASRRNERV